MSYNPSCARQLGAGALQLFGSGSPPGGEALLSTLPCALADHAALDLGTYPSPETPACPWESWYSADRGRGRPGMLKVLDVPKIDQRAANCYRVGASFGGRTAMIWW